MGQLLMSIGGAIVGFVVGGPMGAAIGFSIGSAIGGMIFAPTIQGPRLQDLKVSASTYGKPIPDLYGTCRLGTNMIWSTGIKETKKTQRAGKGGPKVTTYTYDATFAMAICAGPIGELLRIWADGKLIYDKRAGVGRGLVVLNPTPWRNILGAMVAAMLGKKLAKPISLRLYKGSEEQLPDSLIVADKGENASAHRGLAYLVFEKFQLADFGNRIPNITVEVTKAAGSQAPAILATVADGETAAPYNYFFPDWENGRLFGSDGAVTYSGDLGTMNFPDQTPMPFAMRGGKFLPEANVFLFETGASNNRVTHIRDLDTGYAYVTSGGSRGNTFGQEGTWFDTTIERQGEGCVKREYFGALGCYGGCYTPYPLGGGRWIFAHWTWYGSIWFFDKGSEAPQGFRRAAFVPKCVIEGKRSPGGGQMIGWRATGSALQVEIFDVPASIEGHYQWDVCEWHSSGQPTSRVLNLNPWTSILYTAHPEARTYEPFVVLYDSSDDTIFSIGRVGNVGGWNPVRAFKYHVASGQYKWYKEYPDARPPGDAMQYSRIHGGSFGWMNWRYTVGHDYYQINLSNGELEVTLPYDVNVFGESRGWGFDQHWDDTSSSLVIGTATGYRRIFFRAGSGAITVKDVIADVCERTGVLTAADIDVSAVNSDTMLGYLIDRDCSTRDVLKQLANGYFFDCYESDYKIKFRSRGGAPVVTINQEDVGRGSGDDNGKIVTETFQQELEMPMRVTVNFYDYDRDHQEGSQSAKRIAGPVETMRTKKEDVMDLPIVWQATDAKRVADKGLKMLWASRWGYNFQLPWRFMKYEPSDVVTLNMNNGVQHTIRLENIGMGADFSLEVKGTSEKASAYVSTAVGSSGEGLPGQYIPSLLPSYPLLLNTPLLRDIDFDPANTSTCYVSAYSKGSTFGGSTIFMGDAVEWNAVAAIDDSAAIGVALDALPATTAYESTDNETVIRIKLSNADAELESVSQEVLLEGSANAAAIGDEIIQFRDAYLEADGYWRITGLLRARRGTNYAVNNHMPGERFVLLNELSVGKFNRTPQDYFTTRGFKSVTTTTTLEDAKGEIHDLVPRDLMPYTPEDFEITDDGTDIMISCSRRSRMSGPLRDGSEFVSYREGETAKAKMVCRVYANCGLEDVDRLEPDNGVQSDEAQGAFETYLFDLRAIDISRPSFVFPLATAIPTPGADPDLPDRFLMQCYEVGIVDGISKWIEWRRIGEDRWDRFEAY